MSDRMRPIPFEQLMKWALTEHQNGKSIFGIPADKFFRKTDDRHLNLFGSSLENPLGPAAGPHTQLAQNIIAAYLAGSRFFELKTVQTLDGEDLPVSKPCILAEDEGYNVEWSTELTVPEAFNEYVKAWFALNILSKKFSLGSNQGFMFNMSVGYDLEGIQSLKIDAFIEGLKDASGTPIWMECRQFLRGHLDLFHGIDQKLIEGISPRICNSITLSTLHGCPPEEIEKIARYLIREKKLNTYVKCNPTLLGYEFARNTLDKMGYDYLAFDDHHFRNDLQFSDAVPMITRLKFYAEEHNLVFGVKLSNTFPVKIARGELPGEEMYMSGRALYPLTINLAYKLAKEFDGDLRISYSGGADFFNIDQIYRTGIWPITLATTLLKPGGYLRLRQTADLLEREYHGPDFDGIDLERLKKLAESSLANPYHLKERKETANRKLVKNLPLTDCFIAPCKEGCPIGQDIPEYIRLVGEGRHLEALEVITAKNPLPFITGTLCNHRCMTKCTRIDYDEPVAVRASKLEAAESAFAEFFARLNPKQVKSGFKVAVIGAGPAGLAAGYFLAKSGIDVTIFERKTEIGGIIEHIAPRFRISREAVNHDMELIKKTGVNFQLGVAENFSVETLKSEGFKYVFIAIGAWKPGVLELEATDRDVINVLEFLETFNKTPQNLNLGKNVAVIGAGNSAMDAARAARRVSGVENVYLVYRRTRKYMPADREELRLALEEGVEFKELLAPVSFNQSVLRCQVMELGSPDSSGRRSPVAVPGRFIDLTVDSLIAAVGEKVDSRHLTENGILLNDKGMVRVNPETNETSLNNVFIGGDALRGPSTIVEGIADGLKFAQTVMSGEELEPLRLQRPVEFNMEQQSHDICGKKGTLCNSIDDDSKRCLECNVVCNLCVEVCPNRANIAVSVETDQFKCVNQIVHIDGMCNECGNCEAFCPYDGAPYKEKFTLYWNLEDFEDSQNAGFVLVDPVTRKFRVRLGEKVTVVIFDHSGYCRSADIPKNVTDLIWAAFRDYGYIF